MGDAGDRPFGNLGARSRYDRQDVAVYERICVKVGVGPILVT